RNRHKHKQGYYLSLDPTRIKPSGFSGPSPALRIVLGARWGMLRNAIRRIRGYLWIHVGMGAIVLLSLLFGGGALFLAMFNFLRAQEVFGAPLMERLVAVVLLAFFSMLIFSNLIIT